MLLENIEVLLHIEKFPNFCRILHPKNFDSFLIMQELGKFSLKINVISNGLERYLSFSINNMLRFIDSFQFLSSSLDSLVKILTKDDFTYSNQEFDNKVHAFCFISMTFISIYRLRFGDFLSMC